MVTGSDHYRSVDSNKISCQIQVDLHTEESSSPSIDYFVDLCGTKYACTTSILWYVFTWNSERLLCSEKDLCTLLQLLYLSMVHYSGLITRILQTIDHRIVF